MRPAASFVWRNNPEQPKPRAHRLACASAISGGWTEHRNGHQVVRGRKISSAAYTASEDIKERARFLAELLIAHSVGQARPSGGLQKSLRGQRLYSNVASEKTAETRMKSMEMALRDMRAASGAP